MKFVIYPELMGTDQFLPLDGRLNLSSCIMEAELHARKMLRKPTKYEIHKGTLKLSHVWYSGEVFHSTEK